MERRQGLIRRVAPCTHVVSAGLSAEVHGAIGPDPPVRDVGDFPDQPVGVLDMRVEYPAEPARLRRFADYATRSSHGVSQRGHAFSTVDVVGHGYPGDSGMVTGQCQVIVELVREEEPQQLPRRRLVEDDLARDIEQRIPAQ